MNKQTVKALFPTALFSVFLLLCGCATPGSGSSDFPHGERSYQQYQSDCKVYLEKNRHFVLKNRTTELTGNLPFEFLPKKPNGQAILFVHGLGDSPWTFRDIGKELAENGYTVRGILLPGHGTKPADMMKSTAEDWADSVAEQVALFSKSYKKVWLGGFSTGCNLVTSYAIHHPEIAGLILFSPAFKVRNDMISVIPFVELFMDWYKKPDKHDQGVAPFRYETIPIKGVEAFRKTMVKVEKDLAEKPYPNPTIIMMTEHDSVIDTMDLIHRLPEIFSNRQTRFIWYGTSADGKDPRIVYKSDYVPEEQIESFSHMSLPYSPKNIWYGRKGKYRVCRDGLSEEDMIKCEKAKNVWYSALDSAPDGKVTARLMYNPHFVWQVGEILKVLNSAGK